VRIQHPYHIPGGAKADVRVCSTPGQFQSEATGAEHPPESISEFNRVLRRHGGVLRPMVNEGWTMGPGMDVRLLLPAMEDRPFRATRCFH